MHTKYTIRIHTFHPQITQNPFESPIPTPSKITSTPPVPRKCPVLLNAGRGDLISERDLLNALDAGWISGTILDVFETEPLPEESLLWTHPKVCGLRFFKLWEGFAVVVCG